MVAKFRLKIQCHKELKKRNSTKINLEMLKNEEVQQKYSTYVGEYVKNVKRSDIDEDWIRVSKAVKKIAIEYIGTMKYSKKWYSENFRQTVERRSPGTISSV